MTASSVNIAGLPVGIALTGTELIPVVQNGVTVQITALMLSSYLGLTSLVISTSRITGGNNGRVLFDNNGYVGEVSAVVQGNVVIGSALGGIADSGVQIVSLITAGSVWGNPQSTTSPPVASQRILLADDMVSAPAYSWFASPTSGMRRNGGTPTIQVNGKDVFTVSTAGTQGNYVEVSANESPTVRARGVANSQIQIAGSGTSGVDLLSNGGLGAHYVGRFLAAGTAGLNVNYPAWTSSVSGAAVSLAMTGSDTNIDYQLNTKGSGLFQFGTSGNFAANGSVSATVTALGPAGSNTTIQEWLKIKNSSGTTRYIPLF